MKSEKPDQVVFNEETQRYDAFLKPYTTNVGAPAIVLNDTVSWKQSNAKKANTQLKSRFEEIKAQYQEMIETLKLNELVYNASFNFEPITGETYHLYRNKEHRPFLSILAPEECNFEFLGSFRLSADKIWEQLRTAD